VLGVMAEEGGGFTYFLAQGDKAHVAKDGDVLSGQYKINGLKGSQLSFQYLPMDKEQSLSIPTGVLGGPTGAVPAETPEADASPKAQQERLAAFYAMQRRDERVSWKGPAEARVGQEVVLSLMVKTDKPIAGGTFSISADAASLKPVAVRDGEWLKGAGIKAKIEPTLDEPSGRADVSISLDKPLASGEGELIKVVVSAKAPAPQAQVILISAQLLGPDNIPVGSIRSTSHPIRIDK
jgi:hypothetical protein